MTKIIGGFFEIESIVIFPKFEDKSILKNWVTNKHFGTFSSARSVILKLYRELGSKSIWVPEIFCDIFQGYNFVKTYKLESTSFEPDINFLDAHICNGDLVVIVDFFGTEVGSQFREYVKAKSDVFWLQDACHNFSPTEAWSDFLLFSPRKLVGVTDGGILVQNNEKVPTINFQKWNSERRKIVGSTSPILKKIAPRFPGLYEIHKKEEAGIDDRLKSISKFSQWQLNSIDVAKIITKRRNNFNYLYQTLSEHLIPNLKFNPNAVPFAFPIYIENRDDIKAKLNRMKIYTPIHWINANKVKSTRQINHEKMELTLPCDHRYSEIDMEIITNALKKLI